MKILICPDSFKGSASSHQVAMAMHEGVGEVFPQAKCDLVPIADGGEGSLDALELALGGQRRASVVNDALQRKIECTYLLHENIAYVELAQASGLPQLSPTLRNPLLTTTLGTGELIYHAIQQGAKKVAICIGGSATNDAGTGIAYALGVIFRDQEGKAFLPTGGTLSKIHHIELPERPLWHEVPLTILCDVNNPFVGPTGAVATYAPQKGASAQQMITLEEGMLHMAELLHIQLGTAIHDMAGAGAAGGVGGGLHAMLGATLAPGFPYIADQVRLLDRMRDVDLILTGEGRLDWQTSGGKVIQGVIQLAQQAQVPVVAICGAVELDTAAIRASGLLAALSVQKGLRTLDEASSGAYADIVFTVSQIMHLRKQWSCDG